MVIDTHEGLFRYTRLPFGVASAPSIFQRTMECLINGVLGVAVYLDDNLVSGKTKEEHLNWLDMLLQKLKDAILQLKRKKCFFSTRSVENLGYMIDQDGLHPTHERVRAIKTAPSPTNNIDSQSRQPS